MEIARTIEDIRAAVRSWHRNDLSVGLVPTMGSIHDAHLELVAAARGVVDRVVASVFVNPMQFGPDEDLAGYPRNEAEDGRRLSAAGTDLLFAPEPDEIYPPGFATRLSVAGLSEGLCGAHRPGHFDGVATVVAKLLLVVAPDAAWFGEKDYQQLVIVRRLARDLRLPVEIHAIPIVRANDGLALSSRNGYLSVEQRRTAPRLHLTLCRLAAAVADTDDIQREISDASTALAAAGFDPIDYVAVVDAETLAPLTRPPARAARAMAAAGLGRARLIDNVPVPAARGRTDAPRRS